MAPRLHEAAKREKPIPPGGTPDCGHEDRLKKWPIVMNRSELAPAAAALEMFDIGPTSTTRTSSKSHCAQSAHSPPAVQSCL